MLAGLCFLRNLQGRISPYPFQLLMAAGHPWGSLAFISFIPNSVSIFTWTTSLCVLVSKFSSLYKDASPLIGFHPNSLCLLQQRLFPRKAMSISSKFRVTSELSSLMSSCPKPLSFPLCSLPPLERPVDPSWQGSSHRSGFNLDSSYTDKILQ